MEIKEEINTIINTLPNDVLSEVLEYLKTVKNSSNEKLHYLISLKKIIEEDKDLLEKLAQ